MNLISFNENYLINFDDYILAVVINFNLLWILNFYFKNHLRLNQKSFFQPN